MSEFNQKDFLEMVNAIVTDLKTDLREKFSALDDKLTSVKTVVDQDHDNLILNKEKTNQCAKDIEACWAELRQKSICYDKKLTEQETKMWKIIVMVAVIFTLLGMTGHAIGGLL